MVGVKYRPLKQDEYDRTKNILLDTFALCIIFYLAFTGSRKNSYVTSGLIGLKRSRHTGKMKIDEKRPERRVMLPKRAKSFRAIKLLVPMTEKPKTRIREVNTMARPVDNVVRIMAAG